MDVITAIKERHSVRKYEKDHKISEETLNEILEATIEAPSSWNLQHWKFFVIDDEKQKETLLPIAYNQQQVIDSSLTIAVLGDLEANTNAERVYGEAVESGYMNEEVMAALLSQINGAYENKQFARDEAVLNSGLAASQLMLAAKAKGYDTVAMGGFDRAKFVEVFDVSSRYIPVMLIALGKAAEPAHGTRRFPLEDVVVKNTFK
ncbi:nitroreductase family protein [Bacillus solimangrovi]|uniref:NAD(P)H nitroreductase n=1 Tax=Bacillus solimangrovi TaxID=1305675 RepID=A0A1E5LF98_9BACI|nr:nitroreductase family protein [Bacillus solimangrovi]OEH92751.1 NAD(P)H nitroreductase [Bacillus solimangrovi]